MSIGNLKDIRTEIVNIKDALTPDSDWHKHSHGECGYYYRGAGDRCHRTGAELFCGCGNTACPAFIQRPAPEEGGDEPG